MLYSETRSIAPEWYGFEHKDVGGIIAQFLCRHGCKAKLKHATRKTKLKNGNATERATTKAELENGNARTPKARTPNPDIVV